MLNVTDTKVTLKTNMCFWEILKRVNNNDLCEIFCIEVPSLKIAREKGTKSDNKTKKEIMYK